MKKITYLLALLVAGSAAAQEECNLQYDGNNDGFVNITDVLGLLSEFSEECDPVVGLNPCGLESTVNYYGHDYQIVSIGEQCWFAENLRTEFFQNGDTIPGDLGFWEWACCEDGGAQAIYDNDSSNLELFGRLYTYFAVIDERNVCPVGWHVPSDQEWTVLEVEAGLDPAEAIFHHGRGDHGQYLKSDTSGNSQWDGTNAVGFSAMPGGKRDIEGSFNNILNDGYYWTTTLFTDGSAYTRRFRVGTDVVRESRVLYTGMSVRCVAD